MENFKIVWKREIFGEIEIFANSANEAKQNLNCMDNKQLISSSKLWTHDHKTEIKNIDTRYGSFDEKTWLEIG